MRVGTCELLYSPVELVLLANGNIYEDDSEVVTPSIRPSWHTFAPVVGANDVQITVENVRQIRTLRHEVWQRWVLSSRISQPWMCMAIESITMQSGIGNRNPCYDETISHWLFFPWRWGGMTSEVWKTWSWNWSRASAGRWRTRPRLSGWASVRRVACSCTGLRVAPRRCLRKHWQAKVDSTSLP